MKSIYENYVTTSEKERRVKVAHMEKMKKLDWKVQCIKLSEIVKKERVITETSLLEKSELSLWVFKKLRPQFLQLFSHIKYNKKEKKFYYNNNALALFPNVKLFIYPKEK